MDATTFTLPFWADRAAVAVLGAAITFVVRLLAVRSGWSPPEQRSLATRPIRVIRKR
ncbi:hypothetical protein [Gryllotalpicola sp.]|uniref:hypothetical protein n=1 Tax=Gryllotalpicola sp. TaxID=1932787 RepID=UPI002616FE2E|nr:hypothetical protein [Gryllotalpicola sp.]